MKSGYGSLQDWTRAILSVVIIFLVAAVLSALFWREIPISNRDAVMLVLGALLLRLSDVYAFNFSSTSGSSKKDTTIAAQAQIISDAQSALRPLAGVETVLLPGDQATVEPKPDGATVITKNPDDEP